MNSRWIKHNKWQYEMFASMNAKWKNEGYWEHVCWTDPNFFSIVSEFQIQTILPNLLPATDNMILDYMQSWVEHER